MIRKITPAGVVSTLAGAGGFGGFADGTGASAQFLNPNGLAIGSSGTIYVADSYNYRIRKITQAGEVTTLAGNGNYGYADGVGATAEFRNPFGIAVDSSDTLYVTDQGNYRIRKITPAGVVTTLAGSSFGFADGVGPSAQFGRPEQIALTPDGTIYVADAFNHRIRKIEL